MSLSRFGWFGWFGLLELPPFGLVTAMMVAAPWLLPVIITHMTIGDAIRLAEEDRPPDGVTRTLIRCLIYVRISLDDKHDEHGVAN